MDVHFRRVGRAIETIELSPALFRAFHLLSVQEREAILMEACGTTRVWVVEKRPMIDITPRPAALPVPAMV